LFINNITNLATKTVRERLAFNLLVLEEKFKKPGSKPSTTIEISISRTDLANMVGTAKETLVRLLKEFKSNRLIETTAKTIRIVNRKGIIMEANLMGQDLKR
jgi:CRP-like cAMP-binding protein